ncbi:MAG: hypothetical protein KF841_15985 [Phycisphaerae bacterium]|nr:hypothetical protein [Phycisphaerae bacterium]
MTDAVGVRAYQTRIAITRTSGSGTVSVTCPGGVSIDSGRSDYIFFGQLNAFPTTNCGERKAASALLSGGVTVGGSPAYLSTYSLTVSPDAAPGSTFEIEVLPLNGSNGSQLASSTNDPIPFGVSSACVLTISSPTLTFHAPGSTLCTPAQASFEVTLEVSALNDAINGVQALFNYDPNKLLLSSITPGDGAGSPWDSAAPVHFNDSNGSVIYALTLIGSQSMSDAVVATLHFNAISSGSTFVEFDAPSPPFETKLTRAVDSLTITPITINSGTIQIAASPTPTITADPGETVCAGTPVTLDAGAGYASYLWSPGGEITQTIEVTSSGTYSVTVTDGSGCTGSDDITITVNANPTVTIMASSEEINCAGTPVILDAGPGYASYLWSPGGATTQTIQALVPGLYSVTVTNANGCSATDDITIVGSNALSCTITTNSSVCQGSTYNVASVADAGAGATYIWAISGGAIQSGQGTSSIVYSATSLGPVVLFVSISTPSQCFCLGSTQASVIPSRCGDMNNDGLRDGRDIQPFTNAILNPGSLSPGDFCAADMDHDGELEMTDDLALFVNCLLTQSCSCVP